MLELQTTSPQHSSGRAKGGSGLSLKAGQGWGGVEGPRWGWSVIKSYERPQGPDTCHLDTGILELMPVRRSGRTAGIEFLQHQPRLARPDALRWHFKLLFSWSNSKLSAIKKISFVSCMFSWASPFSQLVLWKTNPLMRERRAMFLQISQLGQRPPQLPGC